MRTNRADGLETRRRLLDTAAALFAEKGYHDTKTADICRLADANVAAVHYHFGSKEDLYAAAWRNEFERSIEAYPPDGGVAESALAEDRLRGHILALVRRSMDPASRDLDIANREISTPTGLLAEVVRTSMEPLRQIHLAIIRQLLGPRATEQDVQLCEMSVHAQCLAALMHERQWRFAASKDRRMGPPRLDIDADALADHISRFSLAGLREVRRSAELTHRNTRVKPIRGTP